MFSWVTRSRPQLLDHQPNFGPAERFARRKGLPAVDGGVADVLALHNVDDVLGDVGGMVADTPQVFGDKNQLEFGKAHARSTHPVGPPLPANPLPKQIPL